jgi:hypothetical protein
LAHGRGDGRNVLAHRLAYEQEIGPIPEGMHIHHTCGQRLCINPEHMEAVDPAEHAGAAGHGKLTRETARQVKELVLGGWRGMDIAAAFGCSPQQVSNIKYGRAWA